MRTTTGLHAVVLVGLAAGWAVGLAAQRAIIESTGYADISPGLLVLGVVLCVLAGAASFSLAPGHRRMRTGALAGIAMAALIIGGYLLLAFAYRDRFPADESGETWLTLLAEAWFWVGIPLVVSAVAGIAGWLAAAAVERAGSTRDGGRHTGSPDRGTPA